MERTVRFLGTYPGREKIMRTTAYAAMLVAGAARGGFSKKADTLAKKLDEARTILQLFDGLPALSHTLKYGLGSQERDTLTRSLSLMCNALDLCGLPMEHVAWAADNKMLDIRSDRLWTAGLVLWATSLVANILRSLRVIQRLGISEAKLNKQRTLESPDTSDAADTTYREALDYLRSKRMNEILNIVKNGSDFINAITWLPPGILWSGKLTMAQTGFLGTVSSLIGLYQLLAPRGRAS